MTGNSDTTNALEGIAVVGMAVNFPGAKNIQQFWENLKGGVESISFFSDDELATEGIDVSSIRDNPSYVRAAGVLQNTDLFDAAFFGVSPREAELMDPQHRLFLECSWEALENAGYDSESYTGSIGVYAGMNKATYLLSNLLPGGNTISPLTPNQIELANERDFLTTRISYKLNLKGPSLSVQTACSTSLVAISLAYQSLLNYQCDIALAGGVCVRVPHRQGYWYEETGVSSPDGHCRPFDERAQGTVGGSGAGVVVLKRLAEAITDGDNIYAVIKGAAINNDGASKLSYTAPSVDGQAEVIAMAQAVAGVDPETISYLECHGTGTPLGDPIEIAALTQAFRAGTDARGFCAIGSVKSNIGHLDTAAGVAGFIKTVLALQHKLLPPSLHYESPNPKCNFPETPFYVNAALREWKSTATPRRAGVSSFGFGGTNAHAVLEEAPPIEPSGQARSCQLLLLSAKTDTALEVATTNLVQYFQDNPKCNLADVAYTLSVGRRGFDHRRMVVCRGQQDAVRALEALDRSQVTTQQQERRNTPVAFMFPGQGSQYVNMGAELYRSEPVFRRELDRCVELLEPSLGCELLRVVYPDQGQRKEAAERLTETSLAQPAIFAIEYSLAKLWMEWGVRPEMMIGHSVGEFVAACLAGVFSLQDALGLVAARGRLIQALPRGAMLAVPLSEQDVSQFLGEELALAAVNGSSNCVVSGPREAVAALERRLAQQENVARQLHTSHAFHSAMMDPILGTFAEEVRKIKLQPPNIPFVSSLTATWITPDEATQTSYWVKHLRQTVRFSEGLAVLLNHPHCVLLEVGPGQTLSTFAKRHPTPNGGHAVLQTLRHARDETSDTTFLLNSLGRLWLAGVRVNWSQFYAGEGRHRAPLPTYPFERKRFWIDPPRKGTQRPFLAAEVCDRKLVGGEARVPPPRSEVLRLTPEPSPLVSTAKNRKDRILEELTNITRDLSGIRAPLDDQATFLELGFDSLFLAQANTEFRKKFNVRITFRQLLSEAPTLNALAQFIDSKLPPDAFLESTVLPRVLPEPSVESVLQEIGLNRSSASSQLFTQQVAPLKRAGAEAQDPVSLVEGIIHHSRSQLGALHGGETRTVLPPPSTQDSVEHSFLVPFQTRGARPALFLHGGSFELSGYLGSDQPCYGIQPHGQDGRQAPATVEEMATDYLKQIQRLQPCGPYLIGGYSFGGLVAYEMAQELRQSGQEVALLVLIEPISPRFGVQTDLTPSNQPLSSKYRKSLFRHWTNLRRLDGQKRVRYLMGEVRWRSQHAVNVLKILLCRAYLRIGRRIPLKLRMSYFFDVSGKAVWRYSPKPYDGKVVLLRAQLGGDYSRSAWSELIPNQLKIYELPGQHLDPIKGPNVKAWGSQLKTCLTHALSDQTSISFEDSK